MSSGAHEASNPSSPPHDAHHPSTVARSLPPEPPNFVAPKSFLKPLGGARPKPPPKQVTPADREQLDALKAIREFLKIRTAYDVLPMSFRLIMLDTSLLVKKSLNILIQQGIVSAPLWDSKKSAFAGLLTTHDYINVIQYYWQNPDKVNQIDQFRLSSLREIEKSIGVDPIETIAAHPMRPLYETCRRMIKSRARRIPIVDDDDETRRPLVACVITQYRLLKFIAVNVQETQSLRKPLKDIKIGTFSNLASATMDTPVYKVIHMMAERGISGVPILNDEGKVVNVFESVDVITLIKGGNYEELHSTVGEAMLKRPDDFPGIYSCTPNDRLDAIFLTLRRSRVHRFVVVDESNKLKGMLALSDIMKYLLLEGEEEDSQ